ncbi:hypothetical protein J1N35_004159 [Gossypium stocksii]|uniref:RNase H type-1 domain-containing protein n=1 Tax=Gossypium stocksii TaxID=47602 RepID=A0A9D3WB14_9ROSI|nr:hypothetical protein J1N35_004159 [Gossypium stocksii]
MQLKLVSNLIDNANRKWRAELISNTFHPDVAHTILQIPLSELDHEDFQVWRGESIGGYSTGLPRFSNKEQTNSADIFVMPYGYFGIQRNQLLHERVHSTGKDLTQKVQNHMVEYEGIRAKKILSNMVHNQRTVVDLLIIKIQFDAAFDNKDFRSATRLVVWGTMNEYLASKSILHNNIASPFAAETYAGLEAVKLGIEMGFQEIQILGDSLTVINKCQSTATDYSVIGAIIKDIQSKKSCFQKIEFKYIQKIKNTRAHNIANEALKRSERAYLENEEMIRHNVGAVE